MDPQAPRRFITIRTAEPADAASIRTVFDAAVREGWTYLGALAAEPMFGQQDWDQLVTDHIPPNLFLVAVDASEAVVGFVAAHPKDGELFLLFVEPARAGQGIGRTLLAAAHDALRRAGCRDAYLFVHERNERALAVYAAAGYRADGSVRESIFRGAHLRERRLVRHLG